MPSCSVALPLSIAALTTAACATARTSPAPDPVIFASIPATVRMVNAETTWVAHGVGYELVTRSKLEIPPLLSQLDDQSRYFTKEFGADPGAVIAAVRRVGPPGSRREASAPVPYAAGPVVELLVPRPLAKGEQAADPDDLERFSPSASTVPLVRAWLSARASALTGKPAGDLAASARADDPRVPAWAEDALPGLAVPTGREDTTIARLAMQIDSLYPIYSFLTMTRPATVAAVVRGPEGGHGGFAGRPTITGHSPRGGMIGGGMGGAGRGAPVTTGGNPRAGESGRYRGPLSGGELFAAEAQVFGRYLTAREGPGFIGALVDAQIQHKDISTVFATARMVPSNLERLDIEFHRWLIDRAARAK